MLNVAKGSLHHYRSAFVKIAKLVTQTAHGRVLSASSTTNQYWEREVTSRHSHRSESSIVHSQDEQVKASASTSLNTDGVFRSKTEMSQNYPCGSLDWSRSLKDCIFNEPSDLIGSTSKPICFWSVTDLFCNGTWLVPGLDTAHLSILRIAVASLAPYGGPSGYLLQTTWLSSGIPSVVSTRKALACTIRR